MPKPSGKQHPAPAVGRVRRDPNAAGVPAQPLPRARVMSEQEAIEKADELEQEVEAQLPPKGYKRNEVLEQQKDALAQQVAERAAHPNAPRRIDESKLKPVREIMEQRRRLGGNQEFTGKQTGYAYGWCLAPEQAPYTVRRPAVFSRVYIEAREMGWEPVSGDDPEAVEFKDVSGQRRVGDTILMRIPKDRLHDILEYPRELARRKRESFGAMPSEAMPFVRAGYMTWHGGELSDAIMRRMGIEDLARRQAMNVFEEMVRRGKVPGAPAPGITP